jgi:DNA-binding NtrC family response regulator
MVQRYATSHVRVAAACSASFSQTPNAGKPVKLQDEAYRSGRRRRTRYLRAARDHTESHGHCDPHLCGRRECEDARLGRETFDLCLTDMRLPDGDGLELVEWMQREVPGTPVAVITAHGSVEAAVKALKLGAFDFRIQTAGPERPAQARHCGAEAQRRRRPRGASSQVTDRQVGPMQRVRGMIAKVARSQAPVHISGESGTGKDWWRA